MEHTFEAAVEKLRKELKSEGNAALERIKAEAVKGNAEAQYALGLHYFEKADIRCEENTDGEEQNGYFPWVAGWNERLMEEALALLADAAAGGNAAAQYRLGCCYWELVKVLDLEAHYNIAYEDNEEPWNEVVDEDIYTYGEEAVRSFEKAAAQDHPASLKALGDCYSNAGLEGGVIRLAAEKEMDEHCYYGGDKETFDKYAGPARRDCQKREEKAAAFYRRAAELEKNDERKQAE